MKIFRGENNAILWLQIKKKVWYVSVSKRIIIPLSDKQNQDKTL